MTAEEDLWVINDHLAKIPHVALLRNGARQRLARVDDRLFAAGLTLAGRYRILASEMSANHVCGERAGRYAVKNASTSVIVAVMR